MSPSSVRTEVCPEPLFNPALARQCKHSSLMVPAQTSMGPAEVAQALISHGFSQNQQTVPLGVASKIPIIHCSAAAGSNAGCRFFRVEGHPDLAMPSANWQ